ncbi:MAG TPA: response regulator transcription factor [Terracidiphilus sp.]|nr:response regulator transcription factor [Terracidiphilus sp.]
MNSIEVMLADSQPLTLSGLRSAVADQADIKVLAECHSHETLMMAVRDYSPDVLVVGAEILKEELDALETLVMGTGKTRVILLTSRRDTDFLEAALRCGAKGVFHRDWPVHQIPLAIRKVTNGGVWLEQNVAEQILGELVARRKAPDPDELKIATLTSREHDVINLVCSGLRNKEIADRLHISCATVSHHLTAIFRKLEVDDRTSLVIYSARHRIITF